MLVRGLVLILVWFASSAIAGQTAESQAEKPVWAWTDEERLSAFVRANRSRLTDDGHRSTDISIDGSQHPEFFLPLHLMQRLLHDVFASGDSRKIQETVRVADALGLPVDFWQQLRHCSNDVIELDRQRDELIEASERASRLERRMIHSKLEDIDQARLHCQARVAALDCAYGRFGREKFNKLLYEVTAPSLNMSFVKRTLEDVAAELQWQARGCK